METTRKARQRSKARGPPLLGLTDEDSQVLYALVSLMQCDSAGVTDEKLQNRHEVRTLEVCLDDFDSISPLRVFQNLQNLTLCALNVRRIEGLENLQELEELYLSENHIQRLEGLDNCVKLRKLYLSNNRISKIEGLSGLPRLEVLWLSENLIESLDGLDGLAQLRELWIARNHIAAIGRSLDSLQRLTDLNLAGNAIGNFKEVLHLNRIPSIRKLRFADPHFGENPICSLCNYNTYVLYHLNFLTQLDSLAVSEETQTNTESTFMKKRMYYNMRIKTVQRAANNLVAIMASLKRGKVDAIYKQCMEARKVVAVAEQEIARLELDDREVPWPFTYDPNSPPYTKDSIPALSDLIAEAKTAISRCLFDVTTVEKLYSVLERKLMSAADYNIQRLLTELDTGGNIRYEEGKPEDNWYNSCVDLMVSRFAPAPHLKIYGLKVTRVTRIHNRFLRNRFEEKLERTVDVSEAGYKKKMEYLFFGTDPRATKELQRVTEEGFRTPEEYSAAGLPACIPLCNNVVLTELTHIKSLLASGGDQRAKLSDTQHCLIICKVFLGQCLQDEAQPTFQSGQSITEMWATAPVDAPRDDPNKVIFRASDADAKIRVWFMMDNCLVLPEYTVEFEYLTSQLDPQIPIDDQEISPALERGELRHLYRALELFKSECSAETHLYAADASRLPLRSKAVAMTIDIIRGAGASFNLNSVKYLNLTSNEISKIDNLEAFTSLQTLILSGNRISKMDGLGELGSLKLLDLSANTIARIGTMDALTLLEQFYIADNQLARIDDLGNLLACESLKDVHMFNNPLFHCPDYRQKLIRSVPRLTLLDGCPVSDSERVSLTVLNTAITADLIREHSGKAQDSPTRSIAASRYRGTAVSFEPGWEKKVESLTLDRLHLVSLQGLDALANLKRASFNNNEIVEMTGLEQCRKLEELSLEGNYIARMEGLSTLTYLRKLDLGGNRVTHIDGLAGLDSLTQLSLEENQISSLQGLEVVKNLMELYIANNQLRSIKEIQVLKEQSKLIILDVSGNPMCTDPGFRPFALFHLKKLKVLDGGNVDASEVSAARDQFAGRLTEEILESRLGGFSPSEVRKLDLSDCKLRDFENVIHEGLFPMLQELRVNNNLLQTLRCFGPMPRLVKLFCSGNRLTTLQTEEKCGLRVMPALEELDVSNNDLEDFAGMQDAPLRDLKILRATHNSIEKIEFLNHLRSLRELDLRNNKVRQFDPYCFNNMHSIRVLRLDENGLKSISNLNALEKLQKLYLTGNRISDLFELDRLYDFERLEELYLTNNPITRKNMYRLSVIKRLPSLRMLDDKEVTQEERERVEIAQEVKQVPPLVHLAQITTAKVPVKLTSVNFDGVFTGAKPVDPLLVAPAVGKRPASSTNNALVGLLGVSAIATGKPQGKAFKGKK